MPKGDADRLRADLDDGHGRTANLLHEALFCAPLTAVQHRIIHFIIRRTYCWARVRTDKSYKFDTISSREIATASGLSQGSVKNALAALKRCRVIVSPAVRSGVPIRYGINPQLDEWGDGTDDWLGYLVALKAAREAGLFNRADRSSNSDHPGGDQSSDNDHFPGNRSLDDDHSGGEQSSDSDYPAGDRSLDDDYPRCNQSSDDDCPTGNRSLSDDHPADQSPNDDRLAGNQSSDSDYLAEKRSSDDYHPDPELLSDGDRPADRSSDDDQGSHQTMTGVVIIRLPPQSSNDDYPPGLSPTATGAEGLPTDSTDSTDTSTDRTTKGLYRDPTGLSSPPDGAVTPAVSAIAVGAKPPSEAERRNQQRAEWLSQRDALLADLPESDRGLITGYLENCCEENATKRITLGREVMEITALVDLRADIGPERWRHGLFQANRNRAPNLNYVKRAAAGYRPGQNSAPHSTTTPTHRSKFRSGRV